MVHLNKQCPVSATFGTHTHTHNQLVADNVLFDTRGDVGSNAMTRRIPMPITHHNYQYVNFNEVVRPLRLRPQELIAIMDAILAINTLPSRSQIYSDRLVLILGVSLRRLSVLSMICQQQMLFNVCYPGFPGLVSFWHADSFRLQTNEMAFCPISIRWKGQASTILRFG